MELGKEDYIKLNTKAYIQYQTNYKKLNIIAEILYQIAFNLF